MCSGRWRCREIWGRWGIRISGLVLLGFPGGRFSVYVLMAHVGWDGMLIEL
jgi:hypothetical protein